VSTLRLRTLPAAAAPVAVGGALAAARDAFHPAAWAAALAGALLIQVGTNLANDYYDFRKGADTPERVGPRRASASGDLAPQAVRDAAYATFALAAAVGVYLPARVHQAGHPLGWPILLVGVLGILFGLLYTAGPRPLGYAGLGDLLVLLFFGPIAVMGTVFVQAPEDFWSDAGLSMPALFTGLQAGFLATAILVVNNLRDRVTDERAGKRTLAVRWGDRGARLEYTVLLGLAAILQVLSFARHGNPWHLLPLLAFAAAVPPLRLVWREHADRARLNPALGQTALVLLLWAVLESAAVLL